MVTIVQLQWLVLGLNWLVTNVISQTNNCYDLYAACNSANCIIDLKILKMKCGDFNKTNTFTQCNHNFRETCQGAIETMQRKHKLRGCVCRTYNYYNYRQQQCIKIKKILNEHPCLDKSNHIVKTNQFMDQKIYNSVISDGLRYTLGSIGIYATQDMPNYQGSRPDYATTQQLLQESCLEVKKKCSQDRVCSAPLREFLSVSKFDDCNKNSDTYINWYQTLRQNKLFSCSCLYYYIENRASLLPCLKIQSQVRDNKCISFLNIRVMYQTISFSNSNDPDKSNTKSRFDEILYKDISKLQIKEPNCNKPYYECVKSSDCLKRFLDIKQTCNCSSRGRNYSACLKAVFTFYSRPGSVTLDAIRCQCSSEASMFDGQNYKDSTCVQHRSAFQPACVTDNVNDYDDSVNCLTLMKQCLSNSSCLDSFTVFSEQCGAIQLQTNNNQCDTKTYIQCLDAYRSIWGSILTKKCSCSSRYPSQTIFSNNDDTLKAESVCNFFQRFLQRPRCKQAGTLKEKRPKNYSIEYYCQRVMKNYQTDNWYMRVDTLTGTSSKACKCGTSQCTEVTMHPSPLLPPSDNITTTTCAFTTTVRHRPGRDTVYNQGPCLCNSVGFTCSMLYESSVPPNAAYEYLNTGYSLKFNYDLGQLIQFSKFHLPILPYGFYTVITELNALMRANPGFRNCEIDMKIGNHKYLMFVLFLKFNKSQYEQERRREQTTRSKWRNELSYKERIQQLNKECIMSILFLQASINGRYGDIFHNFALSIFLKAEIIKPNPKFDLFKDFKSAQNQNSPSHSSSKFGKSSTKLLTMHLSSTLLISALIPLIIHYTE